MAASQHLKEIYTIIENSTLPRTFKPRVQSGLKYFDQQLHCDFDRRDSLQKIKSGMTREQIKEGKA